MISNLLAGAAADGDRSDCLSACQQSLSSSTRKASGSLETGRSSSECWATTTRPCSNSTATLTTASEYLASTTSEGVRPASLRRDTKPLRQVRTSFFYRLLRVYIKSFRLLPTYRNAQTCQIIFIFVERVLACASAQ